MRILVTGHRGNVGGPVARKLVELGYDVAGVGVGAILGVRRIRGCTGRCPGGGVGPQSSPDRPSPGLAVCPRYRGHQAKPRHGGPTRSRGDRDLARYRADPRRALVDCSAAEALLGWRPYYRWSGRGQGMFVPLTDGKPAL